MKGVGEKLGQMGVWWSAIHLSTLVIFTIAQTKTLGFTCLVFVVMSFALCTGICRELFAVPVNRDDIDTWMERSLLTIATGCTSVVFRNILENFM